MNERMTQCFTWLRQRTAFLRSTAGLALLAVSLVGLRLLWIHVQRPAQLEETAAAYGSIRNFYGPVQMNHDGSQFIFAATANDRGRAVFLCETLTGKKQQIIEDKHGVGIWNDDFDCQAGPWSPDDSSFLCVVSNRPMVFSADTHQGQVVTGGAPFSAAVWLTSTEFACVADKTNLCLAQKRADGQWDGKIFLSRNTPLTSLTAIGSDTVAWLENGEVICRADLSGGEAASPNANKGGEAPPSPSATGASQPQSQPQAQPPTNGLALWLDASRLRQADQTPVMDLPDLSRNKNNALWNGSRPVFNGTNSPLALNGHGTIHFAWLGSATNGTGLKTRGPLGIAGAAPRSVFVVMRHAANRPMMVSLGDTSAHGALFAVEWSERLFLPTGWWADNYIDLASTDWNLLEVVYDGTSQKGYLNGVHRGTARAKLNTVERGVEIGSRDGGDAKAAEGDFAELLVYDHALNGGERQQAEDYLRGKWFGQESPSSQNAVVWYGGGLDGMTGLAYAREPGELLITRTENGRDSIWRLSTASGASPVEVMQGQSLRNAQWAGPDKFIYASHLDTRNALMLADRAGAGNKPLLQLWRNGNLDWFRMTPDQKQLFLFGTISNTLAGLWRCDLASGVLRPVISVSDYPPAPAVTASHNSLSVPGGQVTCTIYRPANFDKHKKYPLVIGDTMITDPIYGEPFMTGMAACGAVVAVVERPWWPVGIEQWAQNVQVLYEKLENEPTVDTRRVYLFAASAETHYLSQLVETNPAPWRGLILLNPGALPDFSKLSLFQGRPKILLDAGGEEHMEERFRKYQKDALNSGVVTEFYTHPGETHRTVGVTAKLRRSGELMRFIFEE
jgi:hypothetical protein